MIVYYAIVVRNRDIDYCIICDHVSFGHGNEEHDDVKEMLKDIYYKSRSGVNLFKIFSIAKC